MPEGDTIAKTAVRLRPALVGQVVTRFDAPRLVSSGPAPGTTVEAVRTRGKYLLVDFSDGTTLETHMVMTGSWHLYRVGERWRRGQAAARVVIEAANGWSAVCFSAPRVVLRPTTDDELGHLGPDLATESPDLGLAVGRWGQLILADTEVGVVLLDQRVFCGVGNVYKSEVLHACRLHPRTRSAEIGSETRLELATVSHRMLRANLGSGPRTTIASSPRPDGLAVYGRDGRPCRRCHTQIERLVQGEHARSTYWCPRCQPSPENSLQKPVSADID